MSGITSRVYKTEQIKKPLENYRDIDVFKIYVSDTGLLCAKKDLQANDVLYMVEELNDFKGGMTENYVHNQLTANGFKTYYWESERGAEIDFIIQCDRDLIPIEVKSADNVMAKSLCVYIETYKPAYAVKLFAKNFGFRSGSQVEQRRTTEVALLYLFFIPVKLCLVWLFREYDNKPGCFSLAGGLTKL